MADETETGFGYFSRLDSTKEKFLSLGRFTLYNTFDPLPPSFILYPLYFATSVQSRSLHASHLSFLPPWRKIISRQGPSTRTTQGEENTARYRLRPQLGSVVRVAVKQCLLSDGSAQRGNKEGIKMF